MISFLEVVSAITWGVVAFGPAQAASVMRSEVHKMRISIFTTILPSSFS